MIAYHPLLTPDDEGPELTEGQAMRILHRISRDLRFEELAAHWDGQSWTWTAEVEDLLTGQTGELAMEDHHPIPAIDWRQQ